MKEKQSKKYDFELKLKKINPISKFLGVIFGICSLMLCISIVFFPAGLLFGFLSYLCYCRVPECPCCGKHMFAKEKYKVHHCEKCHENMNIEWI